MLNSFIAILHKDFALTLGRGSGLVQALLLGLLLIFLFSLSTGTGEVTTPQAAAAIFWMATLFCQVLIYSTLYGLEETSGQRLGLLLSPMPIQTVWLAKMLVGFCLVSLAQCIFFPAILVFLHQSVHGAWINIIVIILLVNIGSAAIGSLLGALAQGQNAKESLLSLIIFPLLIPLLLAGISALSATLSAENIEVGPWVQLAIAFDGIFLGAAYLLFPYLYTADN